MTEASTRLLSPPEPPEAGSAEEDLWAKEVSLNFDGGYIKSAYGNIVQTWNLTTELNPNIDEGVGRIGYQVNRVLKIGTLGKNVNYPPTTYRKFPRRNASGAAGGEQWTFVTEQGSFHARVSGDVQDVITYIELLTGSLFSTLFVYTGSGAQYGPFAPTLT